TRYIQQWDTAFKEKQINDRSACITMAEGRDGYYVLDLWVGRPDFPKLTEAVKGQYGKWVPDRVRVEDKASGQSLIQQLRRDTKIPIVAVPAIDDKTVRASSVSGIAEAGRIFLPQRAPWISEFINEVCGFPSATHDDITDAFVYALMFFKPRRRAKLGRRELTEKAPSKWRGVG
ncbi:MAG: phage terminase large subunit, partial [Candidatus Aenigmarchaeota archaeon]|nr:phage terminase large subunit [Candidatus Aenigmarchaeota archaeon]